MKKIVLIISFLMFTTQTFALRIGGEVGNGHVCTVIRPPHTSTSK